MSSPPWDSVEEIDDTRLGVDPMVVTEKHFVIVIPMKDGRGFEVGIADGIWPWWHLATFARVADANNFCTQIAMHYRVRAHHA